MSSVLLIGGTGPTGPVIARGLEERGHDVTILHSGNHEVPEVAHLRHLHGDVFSDHGLREALGDETFHVTLATYGRLRSIADVMTGRTGRLASVGGVPVYKGFFDPTVHTPPGLPVPLREDAPLATEDDDGLSLITFGYVDNLAHALLLAVDQPGASMGEIFNCGDDEHLTIRQVTEIITDELGHDWELVGMPAELAVPARPLQMGYRSLHRVMDTSKLRERLGYRDIVPARQAVRLAARWLVENPPERGGSEESALQDPFGYDAEDTLVAWWKAAIADRPDLGYAEEPGYGKSYAGPGTRHVRPDTRI